MPEFYEVFEAVVAFQKERHANPELYRGWRWVAPSLNNIVGRIQRGWDVRIAGEAKAGKTSFMISQALSCAQEGASVFYLGNEETDEQLMLRMITNLSKIERSKFRDLAMVDGDWETVEELAGTFQSFKGKVEYGITRIGELKAEIAKIPDLDMVFIDGQGQLEPDRHYDSMTQAQAEVSRQLRMLTLPDRNVDGRKPLTVVTALHLNDDGGYLWSRNPKRDGDVVLELSTITDVVGREVPNRRLLTVAWSRHSASGDQIKLYFNGALSLIGEPMEEEKQDINDLARKLLSQPYR